MKNDGIITKVVLQNIESHKHTTLNLKPGVNAIVGLSDAGKSAILRGIGLVFTNKGLSRSHWGGVSDAEITFSEGNMVSRQTDKKNKYFLYNEEVDNEYEAFRQDIPDDIKEVLNIDEEINIMQQMDPHFLLSAKGGDVAKMLNKACNLQVIDNAISNIRKKANANAAAIKAAEAQMEKLEQERDSFSYLTEMEVDVADCESKVLRANALVMDISSMETLIEAIASQNSELSEIEFLSSSEGDVEAIFKSIDIKNALDRDILTLHRLLLRIQQDTEKSEDYKYLLNAETEVSEALSLAQEREAVGVVITGLEWHTRKIRGDMTDSKACAALIAAEPEILSVKKLIDERGEIQYTGQQLQNLVNQTNGLIAKEEVMYQKIESMQRRFDDAFPDHCPLCGEVVQ